MGALNGGILFSLLLPSFPYPELRLTLKSPKKWEKLNGEND